MACQSVAKDVAVSQALEPMGGDEWARRTTGRVDAAVAGDVLIVIGEPAAAVVGSGELHLGRVDGDHKGEGDEQPGEGGLHAFDDA